MNTLLKKILLLATIGLLYSCQSKTQEATSTATHSVTATETTSTPLAPETFNKQLIEGGFLKYAETQKIVPNSELNVYDENTNKYAFVDAEALIEFDFSFFNTQIKRMLAKRDIQISVAPAPDAEKSLAALIQGEKVPLYTPAELKNGTYGTTGPKAFFKKINALLQAKNCLEQFYLLYEGTNDLSVFLLTPSEQKSFQQIYINDPREIPQLP
jgi:hypothetical protein